MERPSSSSSALARAAAVLVLICSSTAAQRDVVALGRQPGDHLGRSPPSPAAPGGPGVFLKCPDCRSSGDTPPAPAALAPHRKAGHGRRRQ
ncbi:hypothetical protein ZWY2020_031255 [Hordeum vulgare]|nr:hypothetical protein ZWY2020_031255 [Hordeum vulgare]